MASSIEYHNLCLSNLLETQQIEKLQSEIKGVQEKLKQVQLDISKLKTDPETTAGIKSKRIERLVNLFIDELCVHLIWKQN